MSEPITIIGSDTVVSGNLEGDEDLTIEGRVEGSITLSKTLTIETGGVVRANINVRNAIISGVLVGNIEAQESVHLTEQGRVVGDIAAPRVILVDGSSFRGNIDMGEFDVGQAPRSTNARAASTQRRAVPVSRQTEDSEEDNDDSEASSLTRVRRAVPAPAPRPAAAPAPRPAAAPAPRPAPAVASASPTPAPASTAGSASSNAASSAASRPLPQKVLNQKIPPAPKVRSVGKVKDRKSVV